MKTLLIGLGIILAIITISCSKKYSCKCSTTITAQGYYPHVTETTVELKKRTSKKKAQQICDNTAIQLAANTKEIIKGWDIGAKCELKDY